MASSLLQLFGGSREGCCHESRKAFVDVAWVVHEVRDFPLEEGEEIACSLQPWRRAPGQRLIETIGHLSVLRALEPDAVLNLEVWAHRHSPSAGPSSSSSSSSSSARPPSCRSLGSLPLPLAAISLHYRGALLRTWLAPTEGEGGLGSLNDTGGSLAVSSNESFRQSLSSGTSPNMSRLCISVCPAADLMGNGQQLPLCFEVSQNLRAERWAALQLSQAQHEQLSAALEAEARQRVEMAKEEGNFHEQQQVELKRRLADQANEIAELQRELASLQAEDMAGKGAAAEKEEEEEEEQLRRDLSSSSRADHTGDDELPVHQLDSQAPTFRPRPRQASLRRKTMEETQLKAQGFSEAEEQELKKLRELLESVQVEANNKIDSSNKTLIDLKNNRDEARKEAAGHRIQASRIEKELEVLEVAVEKLNQDQQGIENIFNIYHQVMIDAGLEEAARRSIRTLAGIRPRISYSVT